MQINNNINVGTYVQILGASPLKTEKDSTDTMYRDGNKFTQETFKPRDMRDMDTLPILRTPEQYSSEKKVIIPPLNTTGFSPTPPPTRPQKMGSSAKLYRNNKLNMSEIHNSPDTIQTAIKIAMEKSKIDLDLKPKKPRGHSSTPIKKKYDPNKTFY